MTRMPDVNRNDWPLRELKRQLFVLALPRLSEIPTAEWQHTIEQCRQTEFDAAERIAMVVSVGFVSALLSFSADQMESLGFYTRYAIQFALALPILAALLAPFYLRRLRRGLDAAILNRSNRIKQKLSHAPLTLDNHRPLGPSRHTPRAKNYKWIHTTGLTKPGKHCGC